MTPAPQWHALAWEQVCRHIDGLSLGTTMVALHRHGVLTELLGDAPVTVDDLAHHTGANPGYLHVALGLLANQGWLTPHAAEGPLDTLTYQATPLGGTVVKELAAHYAPATAFLPLAQRLGRVLFGARAPESERELVAARDLMRAEWHVPGALRPVTARLQVLAHLDGHLTAPVMVHLAKHDLLDADKGIPLTTDGRINPRVLKTMCEILAHQGWAVLDDDADRAHLTPLGTAAAACARQYWHPVSYLPTFQNVDRLLFGNPDATDATTDEDDHLDRELDIVFSGDVFTATCQDPFLDVCLPLFDGPDPAQQPALVIDSGCGDGTLLHALYTAIRDRTQRGKQLGEHPLVMVGVEPSPVARRITAERLAQAGIPHLVIDGDITAPEETARALAAHGLDATDALHVSKSVIHDRNYRSQEDQHISGETAPPRMLRFFSTADGQAITPHAMAHDLAAHFHSWRPFAHRHGLVVIEAHATSTAQAASLNGRTLATDLDATHGYSHQYPVEPQVFAWAAEAAGFHRVQHHDLGAAHTGHTMLTIDHFTTRENR
ncbi:hypothetical protein [Streptomyces sp. NBC_00996]|uniref:AprA-related methyltransferase n=1 Tax=Streptomyces sp. NBC_00996 TaxID=2903710 RepID=UPI00386C75F4|nr:hypothetical protein OG390_20105 [Streptomyces sp. NBC_00996]